MAGGHLRSGQPAAAVKGPGGGRAASPGPKERPKSPAPQRPNTAAAATKKATPQGDDGRVEDLFRMRDGEVECVESGRELERMRWSEFVVDVFV